MILIEIMNFNYQHITAPLKFIMLRLDGSLTFTTAMPQGIVLGNRMIIIVIIFAHSENRTIILKRELGEYEFV